MIDQGTQGLQQKLDNVIAQLKTAHDPSTRRLLLAEMRRLMADLDRLVFDPNRFQPPPPK
jgi:hypothetical protein